MRIGKHAKLTPHAQVVLRYEFETKRFRLRHANLPHKVGRFDSYLGRYKSAEEMLRRALEVKEKHIRKNHPVTLSTVNNLASVLANHGKYETAEDMLWRVLKEREKAPGKDHPAALLSVANLGLVSQNQNKYETAEALYRRTLEGLENVLGMNHPGHTVDFQRFGYRFFESAHVPRGRRDFIAGVEGKGAGAGEASSVHAGFCLQSSYPLWCTRQIQ